MELRRPGPLVPNRLMFVVYIAGILGIALLAPTYQGVAPSLNLQLAPPDLGPDPGPASRAVPADPEFDPGGEAPSPEVQPEPFPPGFPVETPAPYPEPEDLSPDPTPLPAPAPLRSQNLAAPPVAAPPVLRPAPNLLPPGVKPIGTRYEYRDNYKKQIVTVSVRNFAVGTGYSYHYDNPAFPEVITVPAKPGWKFIFVGVTWDLAGLVGEGSRTTFVTPSVSSYKLVHKGTPYAPVDPSSIPDILQDALINVGTLAREESIDKDNPGDGILIFEVPASVSAMETYIELCPQNALYLNEPHSPPWDCTKNAIRWSLVR